MGTNNELEYQIPRYLSWKPRGTEGKSTPDSSGWSGGWREAPSEFGQQQAHEVEAGILIKRFIWTGQRADDI